MEAFSECASCNNGLHLGQSGLLGAPPAHGDEGDLDDLAEATFGPGYSAGASYGAASVAHGGSVSAGRTKTSTNSTAGTVSVPVQFTGGAASVSTPFITIPIPSGSPIQGTIRVDFTVLPLPGGNGFQLAFTNVSFQGTDAIPTPEPASLMMLGSGLVMGLGYIGRRRRQQQ